MEFLELKLRVCVLNIRWEILEELIREMEVGLRENGYIEVWKNFELWEI